MKFIVRNARFATAEDQRPDICIDDGRIVESITEPAADRIIDAAGWTAMPGGIDLHTHIGGGKANLARLLLFEREKPIRNRFASEAIATLSSPVPNTVEAGRRYLQMGYTTCFEPAVLPSGARQAHLEMIDTPYLNTGGYVLLGNDEILLRRIAEQADDAEIRDYVGWMAAATQCMAVKVVNAGGISAFKSNQRLMNLDTLHPVWNISPRDILFRLAKAVDTLQLPHPLHVHCSNLGQRGNIASTLATIDAVDGHRIHLTHAQFHCYGEAGKSKFNSAARLLADRVNNSDKITIDVGQVLFGQTVTLSADTPHQFSNRKLARPRKAIFQDLSCQAGCGVVPFKYRHDQFVNSLQWAIGLELFLMVENPWQVFLTTDHPNGAPFTSYPHLIKLLCDHDFRMQIFEQLHPAIKDYCELPTLKREYSLAEIEIITRRGPAKILGLQDRLDLSIGSQADIAFYLNDSNLEAMFADAAMVISGGEIVYEAGHYKEAKERKSILRANVDTAIQLPRSITNLWPNYNSGLPISSFQIRNDQLLAQGVKLAIAR